MQASDAAPLCMIAAGGTGGHMFPAQALGDRDWAGVRAATEAALQEIR